MGNILLKSTRPPWSTYARTTVALLFSLVMAFPFVWMISASLKVETQVFTNPIVWIPYPVIWENYLRVFSVVPFARYYINSVIVTASALVIALSTSSLGAYAYAKLRFPGQRGLLLVHLSTLMVPIHAIMIPQFIIMRNLGLMNNRLAVILLPAFNPFGVFLLRQFFVSIPDELSQAARIDGCSEWQIYRQVIMPLSGPGLASLTVFFFVWVWNDFLYPLIYLSSDAKKTIQVGIRSFLATNTQNYALLMAAAAMSLIPVIIIFLLAQRTFVEGVARSGVKG